MNSLKSISFFIALGAAITTTAAPAKKAAAKRNVAATADVNFDKGDYSKASAAEIADLRQLLTEMGHMGELIEKMNRWRRNGGVDLGLLDTENDTKMKAQLEFCDYSHKHNEPSQTPARKTFATPGYVGVFNIDGYECPIALTSRLDYKGAKGENPKGDFEAKLVADYKVVKPEFLQFTDLKSITVKNAGSSKVLGDQSNTQIVTEGEIESAKLGVVPYDFKVSFNARMKDPKTPSSDVNGTMRLKLKGKYLKIEMTGNLVWSQPKTLRYKLNGVALKREEYLGLLGTEPKQVGARLTISGFPLEKVWANRVDCALKAAIDPWNQDKSIDWNSTTCGLE